MTNRVVITGIGTINALGKTTSDYWDSLINGRCGIIPIKDRWQRIYKFYDEEVTPWIGGEISGYHPQDYFNRRELMLLDPVSQFALIAAKEAVQDAGLEFDDQMKENTAIVIGTSTGGDESRDEASYRFFSEKSRLSNFTIIRSMDNAPTSHLSIKYGITGPCYTIQSACASSAQAIGQSYMLLKQGMIDFAITGGTENLPSLGLFKAWEAMRILAPDNCRPFSLNRKGLVLGEGAGILVLETMESAKKRKADIYGEIVGFSMTSDAKDIVAPSFKGACHAMKKALQSSKIAPSEIGYINAHGTGTKLNDVTEIAAIKEIFGHHAKRLAVSSTKSMHGHGLGAASVLEAIATVYALKNSIIPPTANFDKADPDCDLDIIPNEAREKSMKYAMSNSFGFGGSNGVLVFQKFE